MNDDMKRPVDKLMDGTVHVSIWKNEGSNGSFYNVTVEKRYTDDKEQWHSTHSFGRSDLEKLRGLIDQAIEKIDGMPAGKAE